MNICLGPEPEKVSSAKVVAVSKARTVEEDQGYFTSYAHYGIHQEMLADKVINGAKILPLTHINSFKFNLT